MNMRINSPKIGRECKAKVLNLRDVAVILKSQTFALLLSSGANLQILSEPAGDCDRLPSREETVFFPRFWRVVNELLIALLNQDVEPCCIRIAEVMDFLPATKHQKSTSSSHHSSPGSKRLDPGSKL
jgi:hypothetical protein